MRQTLLIFQLLKNSIFGFSQLKLKTVGKNELDGDNVFIGDNISCTKRNDSLGLIYLVLSQANGMRRLLSLEFT